MPTWESQYFALQSPPSDNVAILLHHAAPRRMRLPRPHGLAMTRIFLKSRHSEEPEEEKQPLNVVFVPPAPCTIQQLKIRRMR